MQVKESPCDRYLEPVCCKKPQKIVPVTDLWSRGPLKNLKDSKLNVNESKLFPWSSRISLVPFRTFRGPLFPKPITGQELFFAVSYSKPALASLSWLNESGNLRAETFRSIRVLVKKLFFVQSPIRISSKKLGKYLGSALKGKGAAPLHEKEKRHWRLMLFKNL